MAIAHPVPAPLSVRDGRQLCLFENPAAARQLDEVLWCHSFGARESSLHALATYDHKLEPSLAQVLVDLYSQPGQVVLDPFCGSGTIALEALMGDRITWASDVSPYAGLLTRAKLSAPRSERAAIAQVHELLSDLGDRSQPISLDQTAAWVRDFFHPNTLRELIAAFDRLQEVSNEFLQACLLGILQNTRATGLTYPCDPKLPYLRCVAYSKEDYPTLYDYRDVRSRLIAKIQRTYRRHQLPNHWDQRSSQVWDVPCHDLPMGDRSVDAIITQPPHPKAFETLRAHRLRSWFLGDPSLSVIEADLITSTKHYVQDMTGCFQSMARVLKPQSYCVLVIGEIERHGIRQGIAERLAEVADLATDGALQLETIYDYDPVSQKRSLKRSNSVRSVSWNRIIVLRHR